MSLNRECDFDKKKDGDVDADVDAELADDDDEVDVGLPRPGVVADVVDDKTILVLVFAVRVCTQCSLIIVRSCFYFVCYLHRPPRCFCHPRRHFALPFVCLFVCLFAVLVVVGGGGDFAFAAPATIF